MQPEFYTDKDSGYLIFFGIVRDYKNVCIGGLHPSLHWLFGMYEGENTLI